MSFNYYGSENLISSGIDPKTLRYPYFVQMTPDGSRLVPGMLQQGKQPPIGSWMNVGNVTIDLPERYFVAYTSNHTLVPGSLIQADRFPKGKWKEVKRQRLSGFHKVVADADSTYFIDTIEVETGFASGEQFLTNLVTPVLELLIYYPDLYLSATPLSMRLYYFQGSFDELGSDPNKLKLFSQPDSLFNFYFTDDDSRSSVFTTDNVANTIFRIMPEGPYVSYCIALGVLDEAGQIKDYVVIEDAVIKQNI